MNEVHIYYSVSKNLILMLVWLLFVLPFYSGVPDSYVCNAIVGFCCFMALRCLIRLLDRRVQVIVDRDGVSVRYLDELTFDWQDIGRVSVALDTGFIKPAGLVVFHPRDKRMLEELSSLSLISQKVISTLAGTEPVAINTSVLSIAQKELETVAMNFMRSKFRG